MAELQHESSRDDRRNRRNHRSRQKGPFLRVLPRLRLLHAVPAGNRDQPVCQDGPDDQTSSDRRSAQPGEPEDDDEDKGLRQMRTMHDEVPVLPSHPCTPREEPQGLRRHPQWKNKGQHDRRKNLKNRQEANEHPERRVGVFIYT